jgi:hypothetical protein
LRPTSTSLSRSHATRPGSAAGSVARQRDRFLAGAARMLPTSRRTTPCALSTARLMLPRVGQENILAQASVPECTSLTCPSSATFLALRNISGMIRHDVESSQHLRDEREQPGGTRTVGTGHAERAAHGDHPGGDRTRSGTRWMGDTPSAVGVTTTEASTQGCVSPRNAGEPKLRRRCTLCAHVTKAAARILTAFS